MKLKQLVLLASVVTMATVAHADSVPETVQCSGYIVSESGVLTGKYKISLTQDLEAPYSAKADLEYNPGQFPAGLELSCTRPQILPLEEQSDQVTYWSCEAEAWVEGSIHVSIEGRSSKEDVAEARIQYVQPDLTTVPVGKIDCSRVAGE